MRLGANLLSRRKALLFGLRRFLPEGTEAHTSKGGPVSPGSLGYGPIVRSFHQQSALIALCSWSSSTYRVVRRIRRDVSVERATRYIRQVEPLVPAIRDLIIGS